MAGEKKATKKKIVKRASAGAKKVAKRTRRSSTSRRKVAVKTSGSTPVGKVSELKNGQMLKQHTMLRRCAASLRKVTLACKPRSVFGTFGIFLFGVLIGFILIVGFMYVSKNEVLLRLLIDENVSVLDGVPVHIEEEIDYSFAPDLSSEPIPADLQTVDMSNFWSVWQIIEKEFVPKPERKDRLQEEVVIDEGVVSEEDVFVEERLVGESPTREDLVNGAIEGLTYATEDQYTNFFKPQDAKEFEEEVLRGEIDGIGAYITFEEDLLTISSVIKNGPAFYAGLRANDVITKVDGVSTSEFNLTEAARAIRGLRGSTVLLTIYRKSDDSEFDLPIVRDRVEIPTVEYEQHNGVFVIRLLTFTKQTPRVFREALREFVRVANEGGPDRILLDMRGNAGGVMSIAVDVAGLFLPEKSTVLYEYRGNENLRAFKTNKPAFDGNPFPVMTVLVDGGSASSAEILAAALRHYGTADVVGVQTLGKGSVQALRDVGSDRSLLKITVAHWLTPTKESVEGEGIEIDVDYQEGIDALLESHNDDGGDVDIDGYMLNRATDHLKGR